MACQSQPSFTSSRLPSSHKYNPLHTDTPTLFCQAESGGLESVDFHRRYPSKFNILVQKRYVSKLILRKERSIGIFFYGGEILGLLQIMKIFRGMFGAELGIQKNRKKKKKKLLLLFSLFSKECSCLL